MRYEAGITAYDFMDQVRVSVRVWSDEKDSEGKPKTEVQYLAEYQGEGVSDPREWLRDALVAALEAL